MSFGPRRPSLLLGMLVVLLVRGAEVRAQELGSLAPLRHTVGGFGVPQADHPPAARASGLAYESEVQEPLTLTRTMAGTVIGGVVGAAVLGGTGALLGAGSGEGLVSGGAILAVLGASVGYPIGAGLGAWRAATVHGRKPSLPGVMFASLGGAVLGGLAWRYIGENFQPEDPSAADYTAWYVGAGAGFLTHLSVTSVVARHSGSIASPRLLTPP